MTYEVKKTGASNVEVYGGSSKMGVYKMLLRELPQEVVQLWHNELQQGRKDSSKFINPTEIQGLNFETSMSGDRCERYIERLLNIALDRNAIESYKVIGKENEPKKEPKKPNPSQGDKKDNFKDAFNSAIPTPEPKEEPKASEEPDEPKEEPKGEPRKEPKNPPKAKMSEPPKEVSWYERAKIYISNGINLYLYGEAGTGKGYNARKLAMELNPSLKEQECFYQVNKIGDEYQLLGFNDANGRYIDTKLYRACKFASENPESKPIFMFDEMDVSAPDALKCFNEAVNAKEMTFPNGEFIQFPNLVFIAAGNTLGNGSTEKYTANNIDKSTLDRYAIIQTHYEWDVEMKIADNDEALVDFINKFRAECAEEKLPVIVSYRSLQRLHSLKNSGIPLRDIVKDCLLKGMADDDVRMVANNMTMYRNDWFEALKECA